MSANMLWITLLCAGGASALRFNQPAEGGLDIVMVSQDLDCVAKYSIQKLQEHVKHRKIYMITKGGVCEAKKDEMPEGVECVNEDEAVPGLNRKEMRKTFSIMDRYYRSKMAGHTGWFLQQFVKLAYPLSNPDISEDFLAFDSDMFPTSNVTLYQDGIPVIKSGGHSSHLNKQYEEAYKFLSGGAQLLTPKDASEEDKTSYNVHHMLFRKAWVNEMLDQFGLAAPWDALQVSQMVFQMSSFPKFAQAAMSHAAQKNHTYGFSEYAMYASWVHSHHRDEVVLLTNQSGPMLHKRERFCTRLGEEENCCPADHMFEKDPECYGSEISGMEGHKNHNPKEVEKGWFEKLPFWRKDPECKKMALMQEIDWATEELEQ